MHLTPREHEKLLIFTAAEVARRRCSARSTTYGRSPASGCSMPPRSTCASRDVDTRCWQPYEASPLHFW